MLTLNPVLCSCLTETTFVTDLKHFLKGRSLANILLCCLAFAFSPPFSQREETKADSLPRSAWLPRGSLTLQPFLQAREPWLRLRARY